MARADGREPPGAEVLRCDPELAPVPEGRRAVTVRPPTTVGATIAGPSTGGQSDGSEARGNSARGRTAPPPRPGGRTGGDRLDRVRRGRGARWHHGYSGGEGTL